MGALAERVRGRVRTQAIFTTSADSIPERSLTDCGVCREYFFQLQRLIAEAGDATQAKVVEAQAALDAVHEATWGFAHYSDRLKKNVRPYTVNGTQLLELKQRVGRVINQWW